MSPRFQLEERVVVAVVGGGADDGGVRASETGKEGTDVIVICV